MRIRLLLGLLVLGFVAFTWAGEATPKNKPTTTDLWIETTLATQDKNIRQFAFDGDPKTSFISKQNPTKKDHFTLRFDKKVIVSSIRVLSGKPGDEKSLVAAQLEVSTDGGNFEPLTEIKSEDVVAKLDQRKLRSVRIKPSADLEAPLILREIIIESEPKLEPFRYPVEIVVDVTDAPEMKEWAEKTAQLCERTYAFINDELQSEGFKPPQYVKMTLKKSYKGVAYASGGNIVGSVNYFTKNPNDIGAMIHETTHVVQKYRTPNNPGWLVEGIADYVRFVKIEPEKIGPMNPEKVKYDGSYRQSAAFLGYVASKYDKDLVRKLNKSMREGEYREETFRALTGKTVQELGKEWKESLSR